jgi:post-segregation antitoxin (ccd killing protein)
MFMPTITASIGITPEMWEKCRRYKLNRSAIARRAIEQEIERIETGVKSAKTAPGYHSLGGQDNVTR